MHMLNTVMLQISAQALIEFTKLWGGRLFEGHACIIVSIVHEFNKSNMQERCYKLLFSRALFTYK